MWRAAILCCAAVFATSAQAQIEAARYSAPTTRYAHGVLGDAIEYGALTLEMAAGPDRRIVLPDTRVFEDIAPRLADLDGDGAPEVITVESDNQRGARLSIYGPDGLIAATPFIGRPYRWLAPIGAADLDGDGYTEIAYIDRPHLAKLLRVWRFKDGQLELVAEQNGLTNHRIGDDFITGGIRDCGQGPEMITADADWGQVLSTQLRAGGFSTRTLGQIGGGASVEKALGC